MAHGLIRLGFVRDRPTQQMHDLLLTRKQRVRERSSYTQRIQKALERSQHQARHGGHRYSGLSGRRMLDKLIDGETPPRALATLAHRNIHATSEQLKATLRGRVEKHHCFLLRPHRDQIDVIYAAIQNSDEEVDNNVEPVRAAAGLLIDIPGLS